MTIENIKDTYYAIRESGIHINIQDINELADLMIILEKIKLATDLTIELGININDYIYNESKGKTTYRFPTIIRLNSVMDIRTDNCLVGHQCVETTGEWYSDLYENYYKNSIPLNVLKCPENYPEYFI